MRIKQFSVTKLFGIFDHTIPLNMDERITIIHGPNGFGKTALLKMLNALFNSRYSELRAVPFKEFCVDFDDATSIRLIKNDEIHQEKPNKNGNPNELVFVFFDKNIELYSLPLVNLVTLNIHSSSHSLLLDQAETDPLNVTAWLRTDVEEISSFRNLLVHHYLNLQASTAKQKQTTFSDENVDLKQAIADLKRIRNSIHVRLIETQRLLTIQSSRRLRASNKQQSMEATVKKHSEELAEKMRETTEEYAKTSQSLAKTFPKRLVEKTKQSNISPDEFREKLNTLEKKRTFLTGAGLLEEDPETDFQLPKEVDKEIENALSIYAEDEEKKLGVFDDIAAKIDLLQKIVNEQFLYKQMSISKEKGFIFTNRDGIILSPTDLSSGEQHQLVLFYELLFKVKPNSLILIDEPEISLHVAWQAEFLKYLQRVIELSELDVVMATHSPDIIDTRWDLTVGLKRPVDDNADS